MRAKKGMLRIVTQAGQIRHMWADNPDFQLGELTLTVFELKLSRLERMNEMIRAMRTELKGLIHQRDDQATEMIELITRVRSGVRAGFGSDSPEYAQVGGTRDSARKPRRRKKATHKTVTS